MFLLYLIALVGVEIGAEFLLKEWAHTKRSAFLASGISCYILLSVSFALSMRQNSITALNTAWQCANVVAVSAIGIFVLKEKISVFQIVGVTLACLAMIFMFF